MIKTKCEYGTITRNTDILEEPDPSAAVICKIKSGSEVEVDLSESTSDFVNICTEYGIEGYCHSEDIQIKH